MVVYVLKMVVYVVKMVVYVVKMVVYVLKGHDFSRAVNGPKQAGL
jgi:hypothetical protein